MKVRSVLPLLAMLAALPATPALSDKLPAIKAGSANAVPACATPGRMMALLKARNTNLDPRFESIAIEYMRNGEELGIRWDFAFYQMIVETGALTFRNGNREGSVRPSQNNFAGLGASGHGEHGEAFKDPAQGVRAHLQHLLMYSGERIADPVADRTRKVQEWGVLTSWQQRFKTPITYADMAKQWAPGSRDYAGMLEAIADQFNADFCGKADPRPELVAEAHGKAPSKDAVASADVRPEKDVGRKTEASREATAQRVSGAELARRAVEQARSEGNAARDSLGAQSIARADPIGSVTIINAPPKTDTAQKAEAAPAGNAQVASAAGAMATKSAAPPAAAPAKCNVFTASYGGQKAVIIKAASKDGVNFTVLDVNEGDEKRETEAFIDAYAKGGQLLAEFPSSAQALDKAFELCPEG